MAAERYGFDSVWVRDHLVFHPHGMEGQDRTHVDPMVTHGATFFLMGRNGNKNGFNARSVAISSLFLELPRSKSHSHAHPEAYLYALQGRGYSKIGKEYTWEQGDAVHIPPGMLHHQHFNPTDSETMELRFEFGIRYWFTDQWTGSRTIDKDLHYSPLHDDE